MVSRHGISQQTTHTRRKLHPRQKPSRSRRRVIWTLLPRGVPVFGLIGVSNRADICLEFRRRLAQIVNTPQQFSRPGQTRRGGESGSKPTRQPKMVNQRFVSNIPFRGKVPDMREKFVIQSLRRQKLHFSPFPNGFVVLLNILAELDHCRFIVNPS